MQIGVDSQRSVENKRVFVVENDEINSMGLQFMLADENETHVLSSVAAAIEKAQAWPPNLILLGIGVVRNEGVILIKLIKAAMKNVRILLVCASTDDSLVQSALAQGADGTLLTPLRIETVRRKVDSALGRAIPIGIPVAKV